MREKVALSLKENKPIYLIFAFGGYKNPWVEEYSPRVEWAELFHLIYILKLLTPIAKHYEPGIFLEYESECEATIHHNNFAKKDVDQYTETFKKLIEFIKPYTPKNIKFSYITLPEQYNTEEFFKRVDKLVPEKTEELRKELGKNLDEALKRPLYNLNRKGPLDLTAKSEEELKEIALRSLAYNHLFLDEDYKIRKEYFNGEERISMVGSYCSEEENLDNWLAINSCARSSNAFWTSRGVLKLNEAGYGQDIIGPEEYNSEKASISKEETSILTKALPYLTLVTVIEEN